MISRRINKLVMMSLVLGMAVVTPLSAQTGFTLHGELPGMPDGIRVVLVNAEKQRHDTLDMSTVTDGAFELKGHLDYPTLCELRLQRFVEKQQRYMTTLPLRLMVENMPMTFRLELPYDSLKSAFSVIEEMRMQCTGGLAVKEWAAYKQETGLQERKVLETSYQAALAYFRTNDNKDTMRVYEAVAVQEQAALKRMEKDFIRRNPNSHVSAYLVQSALREPFAFSEEEIMTMTETVRNVPDTARQNLTERIKQWALRYAVKNKYTDVEVTAVDKECKKLSDIIQPGKYMLLDFWASWCGPCRAAIPQVKKLYDHYAGCLEVCSISLDEKEEAWRTAMEKENMPWIQVWLSKEQYESGCMAYAVTAIPKLVLVDDKGTVVCVTNKVDAIAGFLETPIQNEINK